MPRPPLEVFEHGRIDGLLPHELDALVRFNDRHGGRYFEVGHRHLKVKSYVGYVEVGDLSIEILPKADRGATSPKRWRDGLLQMLRVALGLKLERLPSASQAVRRSPLLDVIAQAFVSELQPLLHEGLAKGYRTTASNGAVFRGRLRIAEHLRENIARADRFFVEYQTFDHDIAVNQLLRAALEVLADCALSSGVAARVGASIAAFPHIEVASVTVAAFERLRLSRSTQRYANALTYARIILAQQGPQLSRGREAVFALLFDMNQLWERYIVVLLRRVAPENIVIRTQEGHAFWHPEQQPVRRVRPDVVVRRASGETVLVLDTKWKVPANGLPSDEDLRQMFVYNELLQGARAMLLYPRTASSQRVRGPYAAKAHVCEQVHVGLFEHDNWSTDVIQRQLADLLAASLAVR